MGQLAGFKEVTPDMFAEILAGEDPDLSECPDHDLDKTWDALNAVLQTKGPPLSLAISGDTGHPEGGHSLEEFVAGDCDLYVALMSPGLVQEIAKSLKKVTVKQFKQWAIDPVPNPPKGPRLKGQRKPISEDQLFVAESRFAFLKSAYQNAAKAKNGLLIIIA
jgi:hypothetical protein